MAEFLQLIEPLVNPAAGQAFHVIAPSLPGYAFSTPLSAPGWAMGRTARAWAELMRRLGYERYGVHGGDIGAGVSGMVAGLDGDHVIGMHVVTDPLTAAATATFIPGMAGRLDEDDPVDKLILERMDAFSTRWFWLSGHSEQQAADHRLRPGRFTAAAAGLDRREGARVDRPAGRP